MGQDKALLDFNGRPLIQRVYEQLAPVANEVLITSNQEGVYAFLQVPVIPDVIPGRGALGGLYTALVAATHPLVAVIACDMPFASAKLFTYQHQLLERNTSFDATVPLSADGFEPFHAIYRKESCLPALKTAIDSGEWRIRPWLERLHLRRLTPEEITSFDPTGQAFININTPADLAQVQAK